MSKWIEHIKTVRAAHKGMSYKEAMKIAATNLHKKGKEATQEEGQGKGKKQGQKEEGKSGEGAGKEKGPV